MGSTPLILVVDIDPQLVDYLFNLTVGFQSRSSSSKNASDKAKKSIKGKESGKDSEMEESNMNLSPAPKRRASKMGTSTPSSHHGGLGTQNTTILGNGPGGVINALDPTDQQLEMDNWHCASASCEAGKITCV